MIFLEKRKSLGFIRQTIDRRWLTNLTRILLFIWIGNKKESLRRDLLDLN